MSGLSNVQRAVSGFDQRVAAAADNQWSAQSPCDEWKARDVVVHVANNLRRLSGALGGTALGEVGADEDIRAAWATSRDAFLSAAERADMAKVIDGPFGPMPAEHFLGGIITSDTLVHTWDLARTVGGDESLPLDLVEGAYAGLKPVDAMIRRPGVFGPKVETPSDDIQTEFLRFLGRNV